jgi:hypothetical protein
MTDDKLVKTSKAEITQAPDVQNLRALAADLLASGLFQGVKTVQGALTVIQAGLELGIPPVAALNTMVIINGRLAMEAKALLAIAQKKAGVTWRVIREDDKGCEIMFSRPGWPDTSSTFNEEEAKAAGLLGKANWKTYPKDMYFARAAGRGIRRIAPDAVLGLYAKEEMADVPTTPGKGSAVPIIDIVVEPTKKYPDAQKAEVHAPAPVKDEFTEGEPPAQTPGGKAISEKIDQLVKIQPALSRETIHISIQNEIQRDFGCLFAEYNELDDKQVAAVLAYLDKWLKVVSAPKTEKKGAGK